MFFVMNWTRWKKWIFAGVLILIVFFSYKISSVYVFEPQANTQQTSGITKSLKNKKEIALTVNITWGDDVVVKILDVLKQKQVKATFFINGEWALRNEDVAELIIKENHEVGLLGFSDKPYESLTLEQITQDIKKGEQVLKRLKYKPLTLVRPPENKYNESVAKHINQLGYRTVFWSLYANVEQGTNIDQKSKQLASKMTNGDIILFQAPDHLTNTPEIIAQLIDYKKQEGYQFQTLTELLSPAEIKIKPID